MTRIISRLVLDAAPADYKVATTTEDNIDISVKKSLGISFPAGDTVVDLGKFRIEYPSRANPATDLTGTYMLLLYPHPDLLALGLTLSLPNGGMPLLNASCPSSSSPRPADLGKILFVVTNAGSGPVTVPANKKVAQGIVVPRLPVEVKVKPA